MVIHYINVLFILFPNSACLIRSINVMGCEKFIFLRMSYYCRPTDTSSRLVIDSLKYWYGTQSQAGTGPQYPRHVI